MRLLVVRHGVAEDAPPGAPDEGRKLTARGRRRLEQACRGLARLVFPGSRARRNASLPVVIVSSPLVRARESADILEERLRARGCDAIRRRRLAHLVPLGDPRAAALRLGELGSEPGTLVVAVGHEPQLGRLVTFLLGGQEGSSVRMGKGGAALLEVGESSRAELLWLLKPSHLRAMR